MVLKKDFSHIIIQRITILCILIFFFISKINAQQVLEGVHYLEGKPVRVILRDGKIERVDRIENLSKESEVFFIAPGMIDNQVNGYGGISFTFGGAALSPEKVRIATQGLWAKGVTTYFPTLTSNSQQTLLKNLSILAESKEDTTLLGSIPGFHMEGPYISPVDGFRGAHPLKYIHHPDWKEFMSFYEASGRNILTITLAPELEGAIDFIRNCSTQGIVVALGHHNASKEIVEQAVLNGAKICTHLGNGCANMINRHNNPLWPQLANDQLAVSVICDGFHLKDEEIKAFYSVKGTEKTIITSDVTSFAGLEPGKYINEDKDTIELTSEGMLRYPAQDVLYGSASSINRGVIKIMEVTGCSLGEAFRMASTNVALLYGLDDRGEITPGKRADLILFSIGKKELEIQKTYVKGKLVYQSTKSK